MIVKSMKYSKTNIPTTTHRQKQKQTHKQNTKNKHTNKSHHQRPQDKKAKALHTHTKQKLARFRSGSFLRTKSRLKGLQISRMRTRVLLMFYRGQGALGVEVCMCVREEGRLLWVPFNTHILAKN